MQTGKLWSKIDVYKRQVKERKDHRKASEGKDCYQQKDEQKTCSETEKNN